MAKGSKSSTKAANQSQQEPFFLSKKKKISGTRSMVRCKVLEVCFANEISGEPIDKLFEHIFFREFKFDPDEPETKKLLTREEIFELEADIPIQWAPADIHFAKELIEKTNQSRQFAIDQIKASIENWELERLTIIDRIVLEMAIAELIHFPEIDPEVTINEAIEVVKLYSTEKSGIFVNGVLDTLYKKFVQQGIIRKEKRK